MRPFTRRRLVRPPLAETWRPGDVAECVRDDWRAGPARRPAVRDRAMVLAVRAGHSEWRALGHGLQLLGFFGLWDATAFRRVRPDVADAVCVENGRIGV